MYLRFDAGVDDDDAAAAFETSRPVGWQKGRLCLSLVVINSERWGSGRRGGKSFVFSRIFVFTIHSSVYVRGNRVYSAQRRQLRCVVFGPRRMSARDSCSMRGLTLRWSGCICNRTGQRNWVHTGVVATKTFQTHTTICAVRCR